MSDEYEHKLEAKSDYTTDASSVSAPEIDSVPEAELPDQELYHSHSWWTTYVFSQDAKYIGIQYALTAVGTGLLGLVLSWLMRIQLAFPGLGWLDPAAYYQFVTMHGMIMVVYLLTALFLGGFGNLLIPLMCGARDMAFPYVNMLSYWAFVVAVVVLLASFFVPGGPTGAGWTLYPPQAITAGTPGSDMGIILMLVSLILFVAGFTMGGLNYIITVLQLRARGMTLMRLPLTIWGIFTATVLAMFAFPALLVGCLMMTLDSLLGTSFFMPAMVSLGETLTHEGGSPILFQHLFWFFGHPEVYIVALPAFGIVSDLLSVHSRKTIFGYRMMVWAIVGIRFYCHFFKWWINRTLSRKRNSRRSVVRYLFCSSTLSYGYGYRTYTCNFWCNLSLVPINNGQNDERNTWKNSLLDNFYWIICNLFPNALPRFCWSSKKIF